MSRLPAIGLLFALACDFNPTARASFESVRDIHERYSVRAAGEDCLALLIRTDSAFDDRTVESIQYGTGDFTAYAGGVQQFMADRRFRAVVYKDTNDGLWTYGSITREEARSIETCR
jgi:hypothetical protein